jgi:hypothetical protein
MHETERGLFKSIQALRFHIFIKTRIFTLFHVTSLDWPTMIIIPLAWFRYSHLHCKHDLSYRIIIFTINLNYRLDDRGSVHSRDRNLLLVTASISNLTSCVKRPVCEADHKTPLSGEVKAAWNFTSSSPTGLHGLVLSHKGKFIPPW